MDDVQIDLLPRSSVTHTRLSMFRLITCACSFALVARSLPADDRPNVLFIAVDDLNDWVGCLGGHPQALTPNIDRLAARGMLFTNAHCAASLCNPSRTSVLTGTYPSTNGVHGNQQDWRQSPFLEGHETLPEYFHNRGYWTGGCGKLFHANHGGECGAPNGGHGGLRGFNQPEAWSERFPSKDRQLAMPPVMPGQNYNDLEIWHWDWGPIEVEDDLTEDGQAVSWAESVLRAQNFDDGQFFLAVGIYKPHGPWYCPREYFDQHPLGAIELPALNPADDLDDVPMIAKRYLGGGGDYHSRILTDGIYDDAIQAYLANVTFADAMVGRLLDALDESGEADNTVIVLWSDHGWHLGEKQKWHKGTNWEEGTRVPMIVVAPGVAEPGSICAQPVSLVDLYPTLLELGGLPEYTRLDGHSLVPQLGAPARPTERPAYTINGGRHQSVRSDRWRYIRYSDGSEELYDHESDPTEYTNLAGLPEHAALKAELATWFPDEIRRAPHESRAPLEDGFRPLFNGYDLTGWEGDESLWRVDGGVIVGETSTDSALPHNKFLVWSGGVVRDFELRLQARILGDNNSGIQYRSEMRPGLGEWAVGGYQCDIHPRPANNGMLYEERGRGIVAQLGQDVVVTEDGRRILIGSDTDSREAGATSLAEWNEYAIIARGNRLVHKLNGEVVCEVVDHDADARKLSGLLALQLHRGNPMRVEFKDLRLRDMRPGELVTPAETPIPEDAKELGRPR